MKRIGWILAAAVAIALPYLGVLPAWTPALATVTAFIALSLIGLNLIFGVTGMLALGQAAFTALPGYAAGILQKYDVPGLLAIPLGIVIAVAIARLVAEIFVRLPGIYLAIGTLGFAFVVEGVARAFPSITGGASGLVLVPPVALSRDAWYAVAVACLIAGLLAFRLLVRGRFLRTLHIVRHDELAARVLGINVARVKANVFTIGSAYSAVGGVLLAYYVGVLAPESGGVNASLESLAMVIIGGAGALLGPVVGAAGVQWLFAIAGGAAHYELLVYGLGFFLVVLFAPAGIMGFFRRRAPASASTEPVPAVSRAVREGVCLRVEQATKDFGGLRAVDNVSFEVRFGQIVALIGPNGAGKSTLFNLVSGIEPMSSGRIVLEGTDVARTPIHRRAAEIGRSFQVPRLVPDMTTLDNVAARIDHLPGRAQHALALARTQLAAFALESYATRLVREIGLGFHKLIELARASGGEPALLLLDEPAVGLTNDEVARLAAALKRLRAEGAAILVVEHNIDFVSTIADEVLVMESGRLIARGSPAAVIADPGVQEAYFGALA
ncbi:MAG TPA: ATP-binding cassette domain-containing protein [Burkholderiales bacterium]